MVVTLRIRIDCKPTVMALHIKGIIQQIKNYLRNQAYDDYEFDVEEVA